VRVFGYILLACFADSVGALLLIASYLLLPERPRRRLTSLLVLYAIGALLGVAFLDLLPTALAGLGPARVFPSVLAGLVLFFILEKVVLWHRCHVSGCTEGTGGSAAAPIIIIGDAMHNVVDGVIIAAVFLVSVPAGIATTLAVILHELFHEAGDLAILITLGFTRRQALIINLLTGIGTFLGAIVAYFALGTVQTAQPYVLAVAAASFLYVALVQLIPSLPRHAPPREGVLQILMLAAGMVTVGALQRMLGG
jgi:zinc and cadmium transporter